MSIQIPHSLAERLANETVAWLTTSRADGMPLPNPVWFLWRDGEFLVMTTPESVKYKNLQRNSRVSLNLNTFSVDGSDVAIFQGTADVNCRPISDSEFQAYVEKYADKLQLLGITNDDLKTAYRLVRIQPIKFRSVAG